jgi:hypothetical protein
VKQSYHTIGKQGKVNEQELARYLARSGQILLPMVDLIEQCRLAWDELIDVTGRAAIEAVRCCSSRSTRRQVVLRNRASGATGRVFSMAGKRAR